MLWGLQFSWPDRNRNIQVRKSHNSADEVWDPCYNSEESGWIWKCDHNILTFVCMKSSQVKLSTDLQRVDGGSTLSRSSNMGIKQSALSGLKIYFYLGGKTIRKLINERDFHYCNYFNLFSKREQSFWAWLAEVTSFVGFVTCFGSCQILSFFS